MLSVAEENIVELNGKQIRINDDFTWNYVEENEEQDGSKISLSFNPTNTTQYEAPNGKYTINLATEDWMETTGINDTASFQFVNADTTGYGLLLYDGWEIPLKNLKVILIQNAQRIDPDARIVSAEKCSVNGTDGELVTYTAKNSGLSFVFYSFVTSSDNGTIQFTFFTLSSDFEELKPSFQEAIAGLYFN